MLHVTKYLALVPLYFSGLDHATSCRVKDPRSGRVQVSPILDSLCRLFHVLGLSLGHRVVRPSLPVFFLLPLQRDACAGIMQNIRS